MVKLKLRSYLQEHDIPLFWVHKHTGIRYATLHSMDDDKDMINLEHLNKIMEALNIKDVNLLLEKSIQTDKTYITE